MTLNKVFLISTSIAAGGSNVARFSLLLIPVFPGGDGGEAGGGRHLVLTPEHAALVHQAVGAPLIVNIEHCTHERYTMITLKR